MIYPEAIKYLYQLQRYGIRSSLEVISQLAEYLGAPHRKFRSIHVGGTNGKGSTAAMLDAMLRAGGYRVGLYTSPHLIDFTERIRVGGVPIPREAVSELTDDILDRTKGRLSPTFFEFATAMAFEYFARGGIDIAVVEVGMGGRLDATNILHPLVSVITQVDYDHEAFLGRELTQIASEKAGIIKEGIPVVTAADHPEALRVIERSCRAGRSPLIRMGREVWVQGGSPSDFHYHGQKLDLRHLSCALLGHHQVVNAGTAIAAVECLGRGGIPLDEPAIREGLRTVRWEGRLEIVGTEPLIILDGAHNPGGARVLGNFLWNHKQVRKGRLLLVVGILADKNLPGILRELTRVADEVVLTRPNYSGAASVEALRAALGNYRAAVSSFGKVSEAVAYARDRLLPQDILCIGGSLYTVGAAKAFLEGREEPSVIRG